MITSRNCYYYLGGKDNFTADRALAEELPAQQPGIRRNAQANRAFKQRAVRAVAASGVRPFAGVAARKR